MVNDVDNRVCIAAIQLLTTLVQHDILNITDKQQIATLM